MRQVLEPVANTVNHHVSINRDKRHVITGRDLEKSLAQTFLQSRPSVPVGSTLTTQPQRLCVKKNTLEWQVWGIHLRQSLNWGGGTYIRPVAPQWPLISKFGVTLDELCVFPEFPGAGLYVTVPFLDQLIGTGIIYGLWKSQTMLNLSTTL